MIVPSSAPVLSFTVSPTVKLGAAVDWAAPPAVALAGEPEPLAEGVEGGVGFDGVVGVDGVELVSDGVGGAREVIGGLEAPPPGEVGAPAPCARAVLATASPQHHEFLHRLGAATVIDHTKPDWPEQVRDVMDGGAEHVLACVAPSLDGAARAARDGALIATPVHAEPPAGQRVRWQPYDGQASGTRLIRMAPWFNDGSLSVSLQARYFWLNAPEAHEVVERGHTRGKIVLVVDEDLAAAMEV